MMNELKLIGARAAANRLGVSRSTLQRMVMRGTLRPVGRGNGIRGPMMFATVEIDRLKPKADLIGELKDGAELHHTRDDDVYQGSLIVGDVQPTRRDGSTSADQAS
jgi:hypothetical protein